MSLLVCLTIDEWDSLCFMFLWCWNETRAAIKSDKKKSWNRSGCTTNLRLKDMSSLAAEGLMVFIPHVDHCVIGPEARESAGPTHDCLFLHLQLKPWKSTKIGFMRSLSCCSFHQNTRANTLFLLHHLWRITPVLPPPPDLSAGGSVKHPVYKWRAEMVYKPRRSCVTSYPPQRFGSSRQEMKGKNGCKKWTPLMTHHKIWQWERNSLLLIPQRIQTWTEHRL